MKSFAPGVVLGLLCACSESGGPAPTEGPASTLLPAEPRALDRPVLIVAVDGLEWDVVLPLLRRGEMPALEGLIRAGRAGQLETLSPAKSPVIWTTVATGKGAEQHGIEGFTYLEGDERRVFTSEDRRTKAYWNILGDHGIASETIGWWVTFPVEPVLGLMVAQTNTERVAGIWKGNLREGVPGQVHPEAHEAEVFSLLHEVDRTLDERTRRIFGVLPEPLSDEQGTRWEACRWSFRADCTYLEIALRRAEAGPAPVTAVYFGGPDVVGHRFWAARWPERFGLAADSDEVRVFGEVVDDYYRFFDRALGRLRGAWPEDTTVFVVSDHGMSPWPDPDVDGTPPEGFDPGVSGGHSRGEQGVFVASGAGIRGPDSHVDLAALTRDQLPSLGGVQDVCPTLLAFLGLPVGRDMSGAPLVELFDAEVAAFGLRYVDSHDDPEWLASRQRTGAQPAGADERLEQLRQLGYLGDEE